MDPIDPSDPWKEPKRPCGIRCFVVGGVNRWSAETRTAALLMLGAGKYWVQGSCIMHNAPKPNAINLPFGDDSYHP